MDDAIAPGSASKLESKSDPNPTRRHVPDPRLPGLTSEDEDPSTQKLRARLRTSLDAKGPDYVPRTHHKDEKGRPKFVNRLIFETSPYLLQHAHNPVNWYPWGDDAFDRALAEDKPVLLSVGYSTCHWCHVMERESFENLEIAAFINEHYVAIKVDREERPDIDDVYMAAVQRLSRRGGGWPMTVIMTPERQPFFGGTYFPPFDGSRGTRRGFMTILRELAEQYRTNPAELVDRAREITQQLQSESDPKPGSQPDASALQRASRNLARRHDQQHGGFGRAPKFPRPATLEFLMRWARRSKDAAALQSVRRTLDHMIDGGIHDHVGGGFHRYSTDARWLVPHFEKMLYDNAQIVVALLELHQTTGDEKYASVARKTMNYLMREMSDASGGFHSATDADSPVPDRPEHREEGLFFTWTPTELEGVLGKDAANRFGRYYGVTQGGNFEGRSILHVKTSLSEFAKSEGIELHELERQFRDDRQALYTARSSRLPPLLDDKILSSWNGLALSAVARAAFVLNDASYGARATALADFLLVKMRDSDGRLLRSYRDGRAKTRAYIDDYAFVIQGLLDLFELDSNERWLDAAVELQSLADRHHADPRGGYFTTADDAEALLIRQKPSYDGAEPSGNSVMIKNLLRLAEWTESEAYSKRAKATMAAFAEDLGRYPTSVPKMLTGLDYELDRPLQIFIVSPAKLTVENTDIEASLIDVVRTSFVPNRIYHRINETEVEARMAKIPALEGKRALKRRPTAFVCEKRVCQLPTSKPATLRKQLERVHAYEGL